MPAKKKLIILALLGVALLGGVAWLFVTVPLFIIDVLPAPLPISVFAFILFLIGLLLLTIVAASVVRRMSPRYMWAVILMAASIIVLYNLSPLAPAWKCYGKRLYVATANAAGQNCTTTCTDNDKKPCSGWSSCWDKFVSCSSAGKDQDGRNCQGCCFSCDVVCEPEPDPDQPPTISGSVACSQAGSNGWCIGTSTLNLTAADPQNYTLTISGTINGSAFTCPAGNTCSIALPEGNGPITYKATAASSGLSSSTGSTTWKRDVTAPVTNAVYPSSNGSNGWHITSPVSVSASGSDALSGLASAQVSVNGGAWQASTSLTNGVHTVNFRTVDNAGNSSTISRTIKVDATPPTVSPIVPSPDGLNGWFVTAPVNVSVNGSDSGSGLANAQVSVNGGAWQPNASLSSGVHTINFRSTDNAGNTTTVTRTVKVDTNLPSIVTSISGTAGSSGWYISQTTTTISANDLSGVDHIEYNQNAEGWQNGSSVVSNDGINAIDIRVYDVAGNMASGSLEVKVDTVAPSLSTSISGIAGNSGWYVSQTTTKISSSDGNSGVDRVEYNQNSAGWQSGSSVVSDDGINNVYVKVYDVAGNMSSDSLQIKVDTVAPVVTPVVPTPDGLNSWFVTAPIAVSANGSDSGSGLASADVSVSGGSWNSNASLSDGVHAVDFRAVDNAGNSVTESRTVKVDTVAPSHSASISGTAGNSGWYVSQTITNISSNDGTSGVDRVQYNQNNAGWQNGFSVVSKDGVNNISIRAYDLAGNMSSDSTLVKVDTVKPSSKFTSPANGSNDTVVRGTYSLSGWSSDTTSGVSAAEISLDGTNWLPLLISSRDTWNYDWDTLSLSDGVYPVVVRITDVAGNEESVESGAHITLLVNNAPPHIKLTPEWFIWQSGSLLIKTEYFPVRDGLIVIGDPQRRWPSFEIPFGEKYPKDIKWDRRFGNGILAPIGNYEVTVSACNTFDLCSEKSAVIKIPGFAVAIPTAIVPTSVVEVVQPEIKETSTPVHPVDAVLSIQIRPESKTGLTPAASMLTLVVLIALIWAIASAALADTRPAAILAIAKTISQKQNSM
jgi:hypothetical protein